MIDRWLIHAEYVDVSYQGRSCIQSAEELHVYAVRIILISLCGYTVKRQCETYILYGCTWLVIGCVCVLSDQLDWRRCGFARAARWR